MTADRFFTLTAPGHNSARPDQGPGRGFAVLPLLLLLFLAATDAKPLWAAQGLGLRDFVLDSREGALSLRFSLELQELDQVQARLLEGEPLALVCRAVLKRKRGYWLDEALATGAFRAVLRADRQEQLFILELPDGDRLQSTTLKDLFNKGFSGLSLYLGPFSQLQRGEAYSVELQAALVPRRIPAWKRWTLFFASFDVVPEARYQMDFDY